MTDYSIVFATIAGEAFELEPEIRRRPVDRAPPDGISELTASANINASAT